MRRSGSWCAPPRAWSSRTGESASDDQRVATNRDIIDQATAQAWLPRYEITTGGSTRSGQVDCDRLVRPASYSGTSMVTMLSFDLGAASLNDGDPLTVVADGDTVYSNGARLYLTNDQRWQMSAWSTAAAAPPRSPGRRRPRSTSSTPADRAGPGISPPPPFPAG